MKGVALKILNNGRVYITLSVITLFFPVDPDNCVIMDSKCRTMEIFDSLHLHVKIYILNYTCSKVELK